MPEQPIDLLNCHVKVSHETFDRLKLYYDLLIKWQKKINLVGSDTIDDAWNRHFLDSLQLINTILDLNKTMVDLGSGAGFPGMALAICGATHCHLIESDAKKIIFLKEVARITKTDVELNHRRIEKCSLGKMDVVLSRACSSLEQLLFLSSNFVSHGTICLFHKGKNYSKEIVVAEKEWQFDYDVIPSVTDTQGVILKLTHVRKRRI